MFFASIPDGLPPNAARFVEKVSKNLEHFDLSLLDRAHCAVMLEPDEDGDWVRINLPHKQDADFDLHLYIRDDGCVIYFADAHMHFDSDDDWQEGASDFLRMMLFGHVESRARLIDGQVVRADVFVHNPSDEWIHAGIEIYTKVRRIGRRSTRRRRVCFASDQDFLRLALEDRPDGGVPQLEMPDNTYFKKRPAELPPKALAFFELLNERLEKHRPPLLDERRTRAYRGEDEDGTEFLCIGLPHRVDVEYYLGVDVYADHCVLFYGNGIMRLDEEGWIDMAGGMLGELLFGRVEVHSVYRDDLLASVTTRFLSGGMKGRSWTRRLKRSPLGKKRVTAKRVSYF